MSDDPGFLNEQRALYQTIRRARDDVTSRVKRDQVMNSNSLTIGQITMKLPSSEPPAEEVTPNFRTPSWTLVGAIPIQVA